MTTDVLLENLFTVSPSLIVMLAAMLIMLVDVALKPSQKSFNVLIAYVGLAAAGALCFPLWGARQIAFGGASGCG